MSTIPKVIIQTARKKPEQYIVDMIKAKSPGWKYIHFDDAEIIQFFNENPIAELPNPATKFYSFGYGEHRADLFRYYYLYLYGGVFIDSDAMLQDDIENIVRTCDYFSVNSSYFPGTIFQGFIGCTPRHEILYKALCDIFFIDINILHREFHILCKNMYTFAHDPREKSSIKLYQEIEGNAKEAYVYDDVSNRLVLIHYYADKVIPDITK